MPERPSFSLGIARTAACLQTSGARYALIGAAAVGAQGYVRATADADFLVHIEKVRIPRLIGELAGAGFDFDAEDLRARLARPDLASLRCADIAVDFIPAVLPYFHEIIDRARPEVLGGVAVPVATVEDLLVLKLLADRPQDRADVAGLLAAVAGRFDLEYVCARASALLPDGDPRLARFRAEVRLCGFAAGGSP